MWYMSHARRVFIIKSKINQVHFIASIIFHYIFSSLLLLSIFYRTIFDFVISFVSLFFRFVFFSFINSYFFHSKFQLIENNNFNLSKNKIIIYDCCIRCENRILSIQQRFKMTLCVWIVLIIKRTKSFWNTKKRTIKILKSSMIVITWLCSCFSIFLKKSRRFRWYLIWNVSTSSEFAKTTWTVFIVINNV